LTAIILPPAGTSDALDMILAGYRYLAAADPAAMPAADRARCLQVYEQARAVATVGHAQVLGAFAAQEDYTADGEYGARSWLIHRTNISRAAAMAHTAWQHRLAEHPKIARAMTAGVLTESWAKALCEITGKLPTAEDIDKADGILVWAALHGAILAELVSLATEIYVRAVPGGEDGPGPEDRAVRLATTLGGAGVLHGDLSPECTAMVTAVLDALSKPTGAQDARSRVQRYHDALEEAMKRLLAAGLLPDRAGHPTKALVHMSLAELRAMDSGSVFQGEWVTAAAARWAAHRAAASVTGGDGAAWLGGPAARGLACDAILVPVVTADIDPGALEDLVRLCVELHRMDHRDPAPDEPPIPADDPAPSDLVAKADPDGDALRDAIRQAIIGKAADLLSGPGGLASFLRRRQLGAGLAGPSLPLDVGYSATIPAAIRTAVTLRDQHCQWAGKCDQPAAACEVHHLVHQADGGPTSVKDCGLYCTYHHQVMIHRLGWTVTLEPDGTTTARSPDGTRTLRSHSPPPRTG